MRPPESFVAQPIRSLQTMLRVIAEDTRQIPTVVPDGIYSPDTVAAVTEFQRIAQLPITGIVDQQTWERISDQYDRSSVLVGKAAPVEIVMNPNQIFRFGDTGPYIYLLQSMLIWLSRDHDGIPAPDHNGTFDQNTENAVSAFQRLTGLQDTGQLDKITWKNLARQYSLNAQIHNARQIRPSTNSLTF